MGYRKYCSRYLRLLGDINVLVYDVCRRCLERLLILSPGKCFTERSYYLRRRYRTMQMFELPELSTRVNRTKALPTKSCPTNVQHVNHGQPSHEHGVSNKSLFKIKTCSGISQWSTIKILDDCGVPPCI